MLRQGRVSNAQRRAYDALLPRFGLEYSAARIDLDRAFGRRAPRILEIGFGMGETTAKIAASHPEHDYLALEVHTPDLQRTRVFAGVAGWGPEQLEDELERDDWIIEPADADAIFTDDPERLWSEVLRRKGGRYELVARMPLDPTMN